MARPKTKIISFTEESDELRAVAEDLIGSMLGNLKDARFEFLMHTRENEENNKVVAPKIGESKGRAQRAGFIDRKLHHYDFRITVSGNWWEAMSDNQKRGLTFHLLRHCWMNAGRALLCQHEFDGFVDEYEHFGAWTKELAQMRAALLQQPLEFEETAPLALEG